MGGPTAGNYLDCLECLPKWDSRPDTLVMTISEFKMAEQSAFHQCHRFVCKGFVNSPKAKDPMPFDEVRMRDIKCVRRESIKYRAHKLHPVHVGRGLLVKVHAACIRGFG